MDKKIIEALKNGQVVVLPTDTIYGLHALALDKKAIEKIYNLKGKEKNKPLIILISSLKDLEIFNIKLSKKAKEFLEKNWPNPLSVVLGKLAFRLPKNEFLLNILKETGPLVSTSANISGEKPAETIEEAKKYFGEKIDFYVDGGKLNNPPSTLIKITDEKIEILRQGAIKV